MKTRNTRRMHKRSRIHKRSRMHKRSRIHKRSYKMRGGLSARGLEYQPFAPQPKPVLPNLQEPIPLNIGAVNSQIIKQNFNQQMANSLMAGGGRRKKHKQQKGGFTTTCGGSIINGSDGYGYNAPTNCVVVPTVNNEMVQPSITTATSTLVRSITDAVGDKIPAK